MKPHITSYQITGTRGWQILVRLDITDEEHVLIHKNNMQDLDVIQGGKDGQPALTFGDFYSAPRGKIVYVQSAHQAAQMVERLKRGFSNFQQFFPRNRVHPDYEPEPLAWDFFDSRRFEHTHIVGQPGTGKTVLISSLINQDLEKVKQGRASLVVLDSQNDRLSKFLPRLKRFSPGGDLAGKLAYIGYEFPPALNIFDFKGETRTAEHMLRFFIGSMSMDTSGHMLNIIRYSLRALRHIPHATVFTLKQLLQPKAKLPTGLDDDTREFLTTRLHGANYSMTLSALQSRLDTFTADDFFNATFKHPENKVDLHDLIKEPRVVVINTNHGKLGDITQPYGRFFLAALLRASRRRDTGDLPCYVFVDEAQQYIAQEEAVTELLDEARKKRIALTFAHQRSAQITSSTVQAALADAAVQLRPASNHNWYAKVREQPDVQVSPPHTDFSKEPQMTREEWTAILGDMSTQFGYDPTPPPRQKPRVV